MISHEIRQAAKNSGLTQTKLAEMAATSQRAMSDFLRGGGLKLDSLDNLADGLGVTIKVPKRLRDK